MVCVFIVNIYWFLIVLTIDPINSLSHLTVDDDDTWTYNGEKFVLNPAFVSGTIEFDSEGILLSASHIVHSDRMFDVFMFRLKPHGCSVDFFQDRILFDGKKT